MTDNIRSHRALFEDMKDDDVEDETGQLQTALCITEGPEKVASVLAQCFRDIHDLTTERDRAVAEAAVLREAAQTVLENVYPNKMHTVNGENCWELYPNALNVLRRALNDAPFSAQAAAVLAAAITEREHEWAIDRWRLGAAELDQYPGDYKVIAARQKAVDAYHAALAGEQHS